MAKKFGSRRWKRSEETTSELRTRFRFSWVYWTKPDCGTPNYYNHAGAADGDHFKGMQSYCKRIYDEIMDSDLCPEQEVEGGACVILFEKRSKEFNKETPYILTKDKRGYKIAFKKDARGKKRRIKYKLAQQRIKDTLKSRKSKARKAPQKIIDMDEWGDGCALNIHNQR